jgi:hypothetical protein
MSSSIRSALTRLVALHSQPQICFLFYQLITSSTSTYSSSFTLASDRVVMGDEIGGLLGKFLFTKTQTEKKLRNHGRSDLLLCFHDLYDNCSSIYRSDLLSSVSMIYMITALLYIDLTLRSLTFGGLNDDSL